MKVFTIISILFLFVSNGLSQSCDLLAEEIAVLREKILKMEDCVANSQMYWVNDLCQKRPTVEVISTTQTKTDSRIALIEKCISEPSSRLIDGFCYYFYNGYETYEDAQSICYQHFKHFGMGIGRLYEPRVPSNSEIVYKAVSELSGLPDPAIWIGIDDKKREGDFRYFSDDSPIPTNAPFGRNQPNGTYTENCITTFPEEVQGKRVSNWWNRHPKWWDRPCSDRKLFMCEIPIKDTKTVIVSTIPNTPKPNGGKPEWEKVPPSTTPPGEDFYN